MRNPLNEQGTRVKKQKTAIKSAYDVIVVGSGIGGVATALTAAESGLSVALFEKDRLLGGGTGWAHGGIWVGCNHIGLAAGYKDSRKAVLDYLRFVGGGATEDDHVVAFADNAPTAIRYFERCGIKLQLTHGLPDHYYPVGPGATADGRSIEPRPISLDELGEWKDLVRESQLDPPLLTIEEYVALGGSNNRQNWNHALIAEREKGNMRTRGAALIAHFVRALLKRNVPIFNSTPITGLIRAGETVRGVRLADGTAVRARLGVALATGGWENDPDMTRNYEGLPGWSSMFPPSVNGDGLRLASEAGAAVGLIRNNLALFLGFNVPTAPEKEFRLSSIYELLCPHTILVNSKGERFADESYFQNVASALRRFDIWAREFSNLPCYLVFDSQYVRNFAFSGGELGAIPPSWVQRAPTLEKLAAKIGVPGRSLKKTVERFNGFARKGVDEDFHRGKKAWTLAKRTQLKSGNRKNRTLGTLEEGPYYAVQMHPSAFASGGVRVSTDAQVLNGRIEPISGLYAVGNVAAHTEYGVGYQAGYSLASGMTFGYLAVRHMKRAAARRKTAK